jgi:hypothetical protein
LCGYPAGVACHDQNVAYTSKLTCFRAVSTGLNKTLSFCFVRLLMGEFKIK